MLEGSISCAHCHRPQEACGVFGIVEQTGHQCSADIYAALFALQHRGQQSTGMSVAHNQVITNHKDMGLVTEVFPAAVLEGIKGSMGIGHVHYAKLAQNNRENAQPLTVRHARGTLCIAANGSITNFNALRQELAARGAIFQTTSDTEVVAHLIANGTQESDLAAAITNALPALEGAYSMVLMSQDRLFAARDPRGFRPLCIGRRGDAWMVASECCALNSVEATFVRDVAPGELVEITAHGPVTISQMPARPHICIFEYIYFARPDSIIDGTSVYDARHKAGRLLAQLAPVDADLVVGVPDSGTIAAIGYAEEAGIPFGLAFDKNRYIGRTFIAPTQALRATAVRMKLSVIEANVKGRRIVMTDDSIVRGTTCANIVKMLKAAGAKEVHVRISSPPYKWPCYFGTDISDAAELTANTHSVEELCAHIGADSLAYLPQEKLPELVQGSTSFCQGCFSGQYPK